MSKPSTSKFTLTQSDENNSRGNRKLFENDAYETISKSLFATAKSCHQAGNKVEITQRKVLESFHAGLSRLNEDIEAKLKKK